MFSQTADALKRKGVAHRLCEARIPGFKKEELQDLYENASDNFIKAREEFRSFLGEEFVTLARSKASDSALLQKKGADHTRKELTVAQLLAVDITHILFHSEGAKGVVSDLILDRGNEFKFTDGCIPKLNDALHCVGIEVTFNEGSHKCFSYRKKALKAVHA